MVVGARGIPNVEGGSERNAERIFPFVVARGADVEVLCLAGYTDRSEYRGVKLTTMPHVRVLRTDKLAYYVFAWFHALRHRPTSVHLQGIGAAIMVLPYKLAGFRTVARYGSADYLLAKWGRLGKLGFLLAEWQLRFASRVIAVTPKLAERLEARGIKGNVVVIPNAVDPPDHGTDTPNLERLSLKPGSFVLSVGRVTAAKNFKILIEGFLAAKAADPSIEKLVIVGGMDDRRYYASIEHLLGNPDVIMTGRLPGGSFNDLFRNCRFYVNSSVHEGQSNAVLEAIAHRKPVILSDIPENRDLPLADRHFFSIAAPEDVAERIREAWTTPELFQTDPAMFPSWETIANRTFEMYLEGNQVPKLPDRQSSPAT